MTPSDARRLLQRLEDPPLFAHSYTFIRTMDHAGFTPGDFARWASAGGLRGLCLHINDGGPNSVARMTPAGREDFRRLIADLGLGLHLEISSTDPAEVDFAAGLAVDLGITNLRFYARRYGPLSGVLEAVYGDLCHAMEVANARNLHFDYEQHEDLRAAEIASLLDRVGDARLGVLFDFANSWNAFEEPLDALRILRPWVRQAHLKGARKSVGPDGWGQVGVPQGGPEDEVPSALLLTELLLLGDATAQVIVLALEQEVGYVAPPFRGPDHAADPLIAPREPSETLLDPHAPLHRQLADERHWADDQVAFVRSLLAELGRAAAAVLQRPVTAPAASGDQPNGA
jgi:sugar phosphate isomerase/epimerase